MHTARVVVPGLDDRAYVEHSPGWYDAAAARAGEVLAGLIPVLDAADSDTVFRFTIGEGTTGLLREAYLAGWLVVGELLARGQSLAAIARIPAGEIGTMVRDVLRDLAPAGAQNTPRSPSVTTWAVVSEMPSALLNCSHATTLLAN